MAKWGYDGKYTTEAEVQAEKERITNLAFDKRRQAPQAAGD